MSERSQSWYRLSDKATKIHKDVTHENYLTIKDSVMIPSNNTLLDTPKVLNIQIINDTSKLNDSIKKGQEGKSYTVTEFIIPNDKIRVKPDTGPGKQRKVKRTKEVKKHVCEFCAKSFMWKSVLDEHRRTHTKEKPHKCKVCGVGFGSYAGLWKHKIVHVDVKPFECQVCQKCFKRSVQLKYHMEIHTGTETLKCDLCEYKTVSRRCMQLHRDTHKSKLKFVCEICQKGFNAKTYLVEHLNMHSGLRPFLCDVCGKSYPAKTSLAFHFQKKHGSHKPVEKKQCDVCGKMIINRTQDIARHARTHNKQKDFICHICGQGLAKEESLKTHLVLHTEEKQFRCNICNKTFSSKSLLSSHKRNHSESESRENLLQKANKIVRENEPRNVVHQVVIAAANGNKLKETHEIICFKIKNNGSL